MPRPGLLRRHRDFRHVWAADALSSVGSWLSALALPLLALLALDASAMEVAVLKALEAVAWLFLGLVAGAWMDRLRCRGVLIAADLARAAIFASVPIAHIAGVLSLGQLFAVALLSGFATVFFDVAGSTYLPRLLSKSDLVEANARLSTNTSVAAVLATGSGGFVIQALTAPFTVALNAVSFLWSALWLRGIRGVETVPRQDGPAHLRRDIAEGWRFVMRHPVLRALAGFSVCSILFQAMHNAVWLTFLVKDFRLTPGAIGLLSMSGLVGAVVSGLVTKRIVDRFGEARTMMVMSVFYAAGFVSYALTRPGWGLAIAVLAGALTSFTIITMHIVRVSVRQSVCPRHLYGRVGATMEFMVWGVGPLGSLAGGAIATLTSLRTTLWVVGAGIAVSVLWIFLTPVRTMRIEAGADAAETHA